MHSLFAMLAQIGGAPGSEKAHAELRRCTITGAVMAVKVQGPSKALLMGCDLKVRHCALFPHVLLFLLSPTAPRHALRVPSPARMPAYHLQASWPVHVPAEAHKRPGANHTHLHTNLGDPRLDKFMVLMRSCVTCGQAGNTGSSSRDHISLLIKDGAEATMLGGVVSAEGLLLAPAAATGQGSKLSMTSATLLAGPQTVAGALAGEGGAVELTGCSILRPDRTTAPDRATCAAFARSDKACMSMVSAVQREGPREVWTSR